MNPVHIFQLPVSQVTMESALGFVEQRVRSASSPSYIVSANPEKVYQVRSAPTVRAVFHGAGLVIPDGVGIVIAARLLYGIRLSRVPGADLMQAICAVAASRNYRIFLFGASEATNRKSVDVLRERHPGIAIVGARHGYMPEEGTDALIAEINEARADVLFVALGSPRQELWIQKHVPRLNVKVIQGIGGTLDAIAGNVKRAPRWMRAAGVEWFYRLLAQPSRAHRQLNLIRFGTDVLRLKLIGYDGPDERNQPSLRSVLADLLDLPETWNLPAAGISVRIPEVDKQPLGSGVPSPESDGDS